MNTKLDALKTMTSVVADTGDINAIATYRPEDATTNPSLIFKAAQMPEYQQLVMDACAQARKKSDNPIIDASDQLAVRFGCEILKLIPGVISTEVDARLSFDTAATVERALKLINLYQEQGINKDRVLIKIASTWEGIEAAKTLQKRGINCNLTLLFNLDQAAAAADAGAYLISPFVGRIYDWYKQRAENGYIDPAQDPGVSSVKTIYNYYKTHSYSTIVMGASFRNTGQIEALAGCDKLTISPALLDQLSAENGTLKRQLSPENIGRTFEEESTQEKEHTVEKLSRNAADFRLAINNDAMACEKLSDGIRLFIRDQIALEALLGNIIEGHAA